MSDQSVPALFTNAFEAGMRATHAEDRIVDYDPAETGRPIPLRVHANGHVEIVGGLAEQYDERQARPFRARGTVQISELASFIAYVQRHKLAESVVWADGSDDERKLVCVFNEHHPVEAGSDPQVTGWRDHRAVYTMPWSPEWEAWTDSEGDAMEQDTFADHIEARLEDLTSADGFPLPTDVLQMARDLLVLTRGTFQRTVNPTNGTNVLVCRNEADTGSTVIPRAFLIAVPVFEGGARYRVECRIRFTLEHGRPRFSYTMHRRAEIERDAFGDARGTVALQTGLLVVAGTP